MSKKRLPNLNGGRKTLEQKESYHKTQLQRIAISKQIEALKNQKKALK